jgi:hypothetical protein
VKGNKPEGYLFFSSDAMLLYEYSKCNRCRSLEEAKKPQPNSDKHSYEFHGMLR